ncbi:MAG: MFS transporter [Myxococcota bacterium]
MATFFEGYDFYALTQILPNLRADMDLSRAGAGRLVAFINFGTMLAYLLIGRADRWGRRRVLMITITGYTVFTVLSGLAPEVYSFATFQLLARLFLIAEWATSMVYAAEEFPASRRGTVIGVIQAFSSLGSIVCAAVVPLLLMTPWGWRTAYLVGGIPLVALAVARRSLKETQRFAHVSAGVAPRSSWEILRGPYRRRVWQVGAIWFLTYVCTQNAVTFWKEFAVGERGLTDAQVGLAITIAAVGAMPLVFLSGRILDVVGRKKGALIIYGAGAIGTFGCYSLHNVWALTASLVFGIFAVSGTLPVLNAFTTELFPTHLRGDAFAWCNNLIGRLGYVLSPLAVGLAAEEVGWGRAVSATAIFPVIALVLIFAWLPETMSRDLEDTSRLSA